MHIAFHSTCFWPFFATAEPGPKPTGGLKYIKYQQVHSNEPMSGAGSPSCRPGSVQLNLNRLKYIVFVLFICDRLAVRISLPFHTFLFEGSQKPAMRIVSPHVSYREALGLSGLETLFDRRKI